MRPIIRWAGSKRQLLPHLARHIPKTFGRYIEPFAGSACLFFQIAPVHAILGDVNADLISMYRQLRKYPLKLHTTVAAIPRTPERYYAVRSRDPTTLDPFQRAVRFLYLNRNCFNAVYRVNKRGMFNVPWGTNTGELPSAVEFRTSAAALRAAELVTADFGAVLDQARPGDFVYLDPPYSTSVAGEPGLFGPGAFGHHDLERLLRSLARLNKLRVKFLMSFESDKAVISELRSCHIERIEARRHVAGFANARGFAREILVTNMRQ